MVGGLGGGIGVKTEPSSVKLRWSWGYRLGKISNVISAHNDLIELNLFAVYQTDVNLIWLINLLYLIVLLLLHSD